MIGFAAAGTVLLRCFIHEAPDTIFNDLSSDLLRHLATSLILLCASQVPFSSVHAPINNEGMIQ